jgi:uncharacterized membrane protein YfcA
MSPFPTPTPEQYALLFGAGFLAGGINSLAGGGAFITLPTLQYTGLPSVIANTTTSMAVWPGNIAGILAYREDLKRVKQPLVLFMVIGVIGSFVGAELLMYSSSEIFDKVLPFLLLLATLLFAFGDRITKFLTKPGPDGAPRHLPLPYVVFLLTVIAVYGGYFGGGMGIMTLAVLALLGMTDIHEMNALKSVIVMVINAVCNLIFVIQDQISWPRCLAMMVGCFVGAYVAGYLARKVDRTKVRMAVVGIGVCMSTYYFYKMVRGS